MSKRVALIGAPTKPSVVAAFDRTVAWLRSQADLVFCELTDDSARVAPHAPEMLFVLGGDGTLIAAIHGLGRQQMPIVGINMGKIGYLAEFTLEGLERDGGFLFEDDLELTLRTMLAVRIRKVSGEVIDTVAVNDCVLLAGDPFRIIEIQVDSDGARVARIRGDGLIVATPSGSTAHNMSAGGPILDPLARSVVITPICPYALTLRPVVVAASRRLEIQVEQANAGTTVVVDGRERHRFNVGDTVEISRYPTDLQMVRNPKRSLWYAMRRKLMWGKAPKNSF